MMRVRRGPSLVDVFVLLGIIVILAGLLLPKVANVRTSNDRTRSSSLLKQIALACHNYNDAHGGKLPPLVDVGDGAPTGAGLQSLFFHLLPYIEQENVYKSFNKAQPDTYYKSGEDRKSTRLNSSHLGISYAVFCL